MTLGARGRGLLLADRARRVDRSVRDRVAHADVDCAGLQRRARSSSSSRVPARSSICFDGSISGLDALQLAGANPATYGFAGQGAAVCQLYGVGNPADSSCLIGPGGQYWAYYRAGPGAGGWTYSRGGASSTTVTDGSVEGWRYGTGGAPGFVELLLGRRLCAAAHRPAAAPPRPPPAVDRAARRPRRRPPAAPSGTIARRERRQGLGQGARPTARRGDRAPTTRRARAATPPHDHGGRRHHDHRRSRARRPATAAATAPTRSRWPPAAPVAVATAGLRWA